MRLETSMYGKNRLNISRRSGAAKMDYIFGGALGVIIIGAMVLAVVYGLGGNSKVTTPEIHYKCTKCGAEFLSTKRPMGDKMDPNQMGPKPIDCPKCGAKDSAYPMTKCPKCGKWFLRDSTVHPEKRMMGQPVNDKCPSCGLNYRNWVLEQNKQARRERLKK